MARLPGTSSPTQTLDRPARQERTNKFAAPCVNCGVRVEEGAGRLTKSDAGKWVVSHIPPCPTPSHAVDQAPETVAAEETSESGLIYDGTYTLELESGYRTFRLRTQAKDSSFKPGMQLIGYLSGPDNESDYTNFGQIKNGQLSVWYKHRSNASLVSDATQFMLNPAAALESARCFMCHRELTVPTSVYAGYGPDCAAKL